MTAEAATPREAETAEGRGRAGWVGVLFSALCFAAAALVPFDDLFRGALTGFVSLALIVVARPLTKRIWPPLANATGVLLIATAVTAVMRFVVPAIDATSPVVHIGAYLIFVVLFVGLFAVYSKAKGINRPVAERPGSPAGAAREP